MTDLQQTWIKEGKKFGKRGCHVLLPKELIGRKILITLEGDKPITWKTIEELIDNKIEEAKGRY